MFKRVFSLICLSMNVFVITEGRMAYKKVHISPLGEVTLRKRRNAVNIRLSVGRNGSINVSMPVYCRYKKGIEFLQTHEAWVEEQLRQRKKQQWRLLPGDLFATRSSAIKIVQGNGQQPGAWREGDVVTVVVPNEADAGSGQQQQFIRKIITEIYRKEAKHYLPRRVEELAATHGFSYNRLYIKNLKSKWGSCSEKNNINLNLHLMQLPDELIDYVIVHELAHTREKNHGAMFWAVLDDIYGNAREMDKRLKKFKIR